MSEATRDRLIRDVLDAWTVPGENPHYHQQTRDEVQRRWPTLARAMNQLVRYEKRREKNDRS